jgi:flagellar motility protein MotE (MotC chaperone)
MTKKLIIIIAGAGILSFSITLGLSWFLRSSSIKDRAQELKAEELASNAEAYDPKQISSILTEPASLVDVPPEIKRTMTEKQLKSLIYEVREKINDYDEKLRDLELREQRVQLTHKSLDEDIEELNDLRIELASTVTLLKDERDKLEKSRVEVGTIEKKNIVSLAAAYDSMDADSAGKILTNMSQSSNDNANDAVKILFYMQDRTKAKLLATLVDSEPALAAYFCQRLKQIVEES